MFLLKIKISRAASAYALVIALLSTGVVIAHSCHNDSPVVVTHVEHTQDTVPQAGGASGNLLNEICTGIVFIALFVGSRFLLRIQRFKTFGRLAVFKCRAFIEIRPPNLSFALSLSQLGISRI